MDNPKVLVGCPTYQGFGYCLDKFLESVNGLSYQNYDVLLADNSEGDEYYNLLKQKGINALKAPRLKGMFDTVAYSRNMIIDYALKNGYDYFLNLDQDVIPPKNIIEELLSCKKDIVSGIYFGMFNTSSGFKKLPVAYASITEEEFEKMQKISPFPQFIKSHLDLKRNLTENESNSGSLLEVRIPSNGCMLIKRDVLEDKEIRYGIIDISGKPGKTGDEIIFCEKAAEKGFKLYVCTKIRCQHIQPNGTVL
jgi:GT2 family glycosyltransferase